MTGKNIKLEIRELEVAIDKEVIISNLNLTLENPGLVVIIGPNGAGKTTFFKTLIGLLKPKTGSIIINGIDVSGKPYLAGKFIGYMPQLSEINRSFPVTGRELVESSLVFRLKPPRLGTPKWITEKALSVIKEVGAEEYADKPISELSGGQIQRLMIARTVASDAPILLLDEPTSAIDPKGKMDIVKYIASIARDRLVLLNTHDPTVYRELAKTLIVFWRGIKAIGPPQEVLKPEILREIYGEMVIPIKECVHLVDTHAI